MRGMAPNGEVIRVFRKSQGWTQEALAVACDCTARTIRNAESGERIDGATLAAIAAALGAELADVAGDAIAGNKAVADHGLIQTTLDWEEAFLAADIDRLLSLHHPQTLLEVPGGAGMPGLGEGEIVRGAEALREHFVEVFKVFRLAAVLERQFDVKANLVFYRSVATVRAAPTGDEFTTKFYNELEFEDGLILRRTTISDLTGHRRSLEQDGSS